MNQETDQNFNISQATAVFIDQSWTDSANSNARTNSGRRITLSSMYDSKGSTILLTENLQARNWADSYLGDIGFGVGLTISSGAPSNVGGGTPGSALGLVNVNDYTTATPSRRINGNLAATEGNAPRPSSLHPGGVIMSFCDGRTSFVNDSIDAQVYLFAVTSSGDRFGQNGASMPLQ